MPLQSCDWPTATLRDEASLPRLCDRILLQPSTLAKRPRYANNL
ncbi:hypothetical protein [Moorena sp. SIO2C4]|nr:hypothetical protein [Moorena sp. SIO2C4]